MRSAVVQRTVLAGVLVVGAAFVGAGCVPPPEEPSQEFLSTCRVEEDTIETAMEAFRVTEGRWLTSIAELLEVRYLKRDMGLFAIRIVDGFPDLYTISACPEPVRPF